MFPKVKGVKGRLIKREGARTHRLFVWIGFEGEVEVEGKVGCRTFVCVWMTTMVETVIYLRFSSPTPEV